VSTKLPQAQEVSADPPASAPVIGPRLSAARKQAGVGVRELARRIGVSAGLISLIENGRSAPSVSTLYAIARELDLSFDDLFNGSRGTSDATGPVKVMHRRERPTVQLATGVRWERLTHTDRPDFEFLHVVYEVGGASCDADAKLQHGGQEYALLLDGALGLTIADEEFRLEPGDSISFDAGAPHRIWNAGDRPARAMWVVLQRRNDRRIAPEGHRPPSADD
jgi:transcriptional regulator with XRE-family HTH domain